MKICSETIQINQQPDVTIFQFIFWRLFTSLLENCCIWLVIYLNCTMMHGLTNLKFVLKQFK